MRSLQLASIVVACAIVCGCVSDTVPLSNRGLVALTADSVAVADGAQVLLVTARVDTTGRVVDSAVAFSTSAGTFSTGGTSASVNPDSSGMAKVQLVAPKDSGAALVSARSGGTTLSRTILFLPATPDWITMDVPGVLAPATGGAATVTATLNRIRGQVSSGTVVRFSWFNAAGSHVAGYLSADSVLATQNTASVKFILTDTVSGTVHLVATTTRVKIVCDTSTLRATK